MIVLIILNENEEKTLEYIQNHSIDPNALRHGKPVLTVASKYKFALVVSALIKLGADLNSTDNDGRTAVWVAADEGYLDIIKLLVDAGADFNKADNEKETPLHFAALRGF